MLKKTMVEYKITEQPVWLLSDCKQLYLFKKEEVEEKKQSK
jgi:hypothetical protein